MTATYLGSGDPARQRTDYLPVWLKNLADDVTLEASAMEGAVEDLTTSTRRTLEAAALFIMIGAEAHTQ